MQLKNTEKVAVGILGKDYIDENNLIVAFVDNENIRRTVRLEKSLTGSVSVGDVGIIAIRNGRMVNFLRSSRF